eukprot:TRINITY_DN7753_c0_g1_i2.p2 TRINITY_DN7753_c0_g1~~TRINITY_DN7753_c0_g1_i2.p2  ORF type:complete len:205 (+),score=62.57 TRINITY_DN7753_c0_g1_i2:176-790(+)
MCTRHFNSPPEPITPPRAKHSFDSTFTSGAKISRNQDFLQRELTRRALQDKFKDFYEGSAKKALRSKTPTVGSGVKERRARNVERDFEAAQKTPLSRKSEKERSLSSLSVCSSQCSQCSGAAKKGMEYICINCINKEMADKKRAMRRKEMERDRAREKAQAARFEREKNKYEQQLLSEQQRKLSLVREEIRLENERQQLKKARE